jgi:hypothetical protein
MTGLQIKKYGYSRHPWRYELNGVEFRIGDGQPFFSFARKRDAKPFYDRLLKTGDWTKVEEFTPEQVQAVWEIARETESYQKFTELMNRK